MRNINYDLINYDLILSLIGWIIDYGQPREGSILVFLPGLAEISIMIEKLERNVVTSPSTGKFILFPLHSSLSNEEQRLVDLIFELTFYSCLLNSVKFVNYFNSEIFCESKPGVRKIIVATNLAETSITIEDCVFVIDSGRMKLCR